MLYDESVMLGEAALELARLSLFVFPLSPKSKKPLEGSRGLLEATLDVRKIRQWWDENPHYNIGIACGPSNLVVLDFDARKGGDESLHLLESKFGKFRTLSVLTSGGGSHVYFRRGARAIRSNADSFGAEFPGVDVRAAGGYVVAPNSVHPSGFVYAFEASSGQSIARIGDDLDRFLYECQQRESGAATALTARGMVPTGKRNIALTSLAGTLRRVGFEPDEMYQTLALMNKMRCSEPLPDREIHTIANSIGRKQIEEAFVAQNVLERLNIIPVSEIVSRGVDWFMEGRIPANEVTLFEGRGGLGKSTVALDLLARHSSGSVLPGNPGPKPPGNSLVFADEDNVSLVKARLQAAGADMARVYMVDGVGEDNAKRRFALPGDLALLRSAIEHYHAEVVYIDSLFNSFGQGHSANNNLDVRRILGGLADLSHALGVTIIATRHWGKSDRHDKDRGLGSVDITNVARSVIAFDEYISGSPLRKLMVVKHNYGQDPTDLLYSFEPVDVLDSFGRNMEVARVSWEWGGALLDQGSKPQDSLLLSPVRDNVPQRFSDSDPEGLLTYAAGVLG